MTDGLERLKAGGPHGRPEDRSMPPSLRRLLTDLRFWITPDQVAEWFAERETFFVLAMGRSGTKFLAHLLDEDPDARVVHDPVQDDLEAYLETWRDDDAAEAYVPFRLKETYLRERERDPAVYGEVNSMLRRHAPALGQALPDTQIFHLVRDGRDVVRSIMARDTFTGDDPVGRTVRPARGDPADDRWEEMDRFERVCWYWAQANRFLRQHVGQLVRFEDLLDRYDTLRDSLLDPLGLAVDRSVWTEAVDQPRDSTRRHAIPPWKDWSPDRLKAFERICGDEMAACGYDLEEPPGVAPGPGAD